MIKLLNELIIEAMDFNTKKAIPDKAIVTIKLNGEKLKAFPLKSGTRL
jgi:hypothetical protein